MSVTLVSTEPDTSGVGTTDQAVPFQWAASEDVTRETVARPTAQASVAEEALTALSTVFRAPVTVGPVTWDQAVPFHLAVSGVVADRSPTAHASVSVRADTALKKPPSEGGDGTTAQPAAVRPDVAVELDAAAGTVPSRTAPAAVTIVANPRPRMSASPGETVCSCPLNGCRGRAVRTRVGRVCGAAEPRKTPWEEAGDEADRACGYRAGCRGGGPGLDAAGPGLRGGQLHVRDDRVGGHRPDRRAGRPGADHARAAQPPQPRALITACH